MTLRMTLKTTRLTRITALFTVMTFLGSTLLQDVALGMGVSVSGGAAAAAGSPYVPAQGNSEAFQADLFTGRISTGIPIVVPPGRVGLQPQLALNYSSSSQWGTAGAGWDLGVSYIEKDTSKGLSGYGGFEPIRLNLNGTSMRLIWDDTENLYLPEDEGAFLRVPAMDNVIDKNGTTYYFGQSSSSQLVVNVDGNNKLFRLYLDKVVDIHGNNIKYTYTKYTGSNVPYLTRIDYTGYGTSIGPHRVDLTWIDRTDDRVDYRARGKIEGTKKLDTIKTYAGGFTQSVREYKLHYITSSQTGRSLLEKVVETGVNGEGTALEHKMTYQTFDISEIEEKRYTDPIGAGQGDHKWHIKIGKRQIISGIPGPPTWFYDGMDASGSVVGISWTMNTSTGQIGISGGVFEHPDYEWVVHAETYLFRPTSSTFNISFTGDQMFVNGYYHPNSPATLATAGWHHLLLEDAGTSIDASIDSSLLTSGNSMHSSKLSLAPTLSGDFNGDGRTDLLNWDKSSGSWSVALSTGASFAASAEWLAGFGTLDHLPILGDFNGDGRTDVGTYKNSEGWKVATSKGRLESGTGFNTPVTWSTQTDTTSIPMTGDYNGDGIPDLGFFKPWDGQFQAVVGTSTGAPGNKVTLRTGETNNGSQVLYSGADAMSGDVNGDGLTDLIVRGGNVSDYYAFINHGMSLVKDSHVWFTPTFGQDIKALLDINSDGMSDLCIYHYGSGEWYHALSDGTEFSDTAAVWIDDSEGIGYTSESNVSPGAGDFDGDGVTDISISNNTAQTGVIGIMAGGVPDLLTTYTSPTGGKTTITYGAACGYDNTDPTTGLSSLPFALPVVTEVKTENGMPSSDLSYLQTITQYAYSQGKYDTALRQFVGFGQVTVTDGAGTQAITYFHQDEDLKGRPRQVEVLDSEGALFTRSLMEYAVAGYSMSSGWGSGSGRFVTLSKKITEIYDGESTAKISAATFDGYDDYGNLLQQTEWGDMALDQGDELVWEANGDERVTVNQYCAPTIVGTTKYIAGKLSQSTVYTGINPATGTQLAQRRFYYDGSTALGAAVDKGLVTQEEQWLEVPGGTDVFPATTFAYDDYGNVTLVTDDLSRETENLYDASTHTYLEQVTNDANQTQSTTYDARWGVVLESTDPNGQVTTSVYDSLGRIYRTWGPKDRDGTGNPYPDKPGVEYVYNTSSVPNSILKKVRVDHNGSVTLDAYTFVDGLGTTIQTRVPAETAGKQIVSGQVDFGSRGEVLSAGYSTEENFSSTYIEQTPPRSVLYQYDAVGRKTKTTEPNYPSNSEWRTVYNQRIRTEYDANNNRIDYESDVYGRLVKVTEYNDPGTGTEQYVTRYTYDLLDRLQDVEDAQANHTTITYDTLGRKTSMADPDMGEWFYEYDSVGNLTHQTDARKIRMNFTYDNLNRLKTKSEQLPVDPQANPVVYQSENVLVTYNYDQSGHGFGTGRLTSIEDPSGPASGNSSSFEYDEVGRVVRETKSVKNHGTYSISRTYDALDRLKTVKWDTESNYMVTYDYNSMGAVESITGSDGVQYVDEVNYNVNGQRTLLRLGNGTDTFYGYDEYTRRLSTLETTKGSTRLQDFAYTFDPVGNLTHIDDAAHTGTQSFSYDDLNRLRTATGAGYGNVEYTYTSIGNIHTRKVGGNTITYTYGENGAGPHAVTSRTDGSVLAYDANGNMSSRYLGSHSGMDEPERSAQDLTFDSESRLTRVEEAETTATVHLSLGWNYFSLPLIPSASTATSDLLPDLGGDYEQLSYYDTATESWKYYVSHTQTEFNDSGLANLFYGEGYLIYANTATDLEFTGTLNPSPSVQSLDEGLNLIGVPMGLKEGTVGGLLQSLESGADYTEVWRYDGSEYDVLSQEEELSGGEALWINIVAVGGTTWIIPATGYAPTTFVYDGDGGRVIKQVGSGVDAQTMLYLGQSYERSVQDDVRTLYIYLDDVRIAARKSNGEILYYHGDHLGSSNVISDSSGNLAELSEYEPFGNLSRHDMPGEVEVEQKFTGQIRDASTGLYYYSARYYDSELGRFVSPDTYVQSPDDPQTLNRYSYARNNPLIYDDPSGHFFWVGALVAAAWFGGVAGAIAGAEAGGNPLKGALFGALTSIVAFVAAPVTSGIAGQLANMAGVSSRVGLGAMIAAGGGAAAFGAASGATGAYGGGAGSVRDIFRGAARGSALGFVQASVFKGVKIGVEWNSPRNGVFNNLGEEFQRMHELNVDQADTAVTMINRPLSGDQLGTPGNTKSFRHGAILSDELPNGVWEMGPENGMIQTTNTVQDLENWDTHITTQRAIAMGGQYATKIRVQVNIQGLKDAISLYEKTIAGKVQYSPVHHNSNYARNSAIYAAGGSIPEQSKTPGFPGRP